MSRPSDLIDDLIKAHVKPTLKELGFSAKSSTFFRQNGELTEIVSLQKSKWNDTGEAKFAINLGVYWPKVHEILGRPGASSPPKEYDCTIRQRLGPLFHENKDFWWGVSSESDIRQIGADVVEKIVNFGLPWLVRATMLDEAVKMANTGEAIVLHVIKGERGIATELVGKAIAETRHAKAFSRTLAQKLELETSAGL